MHQDCQQWGCAETLPCLHNQVAGYCTGLLDNSTVIELDHSTRTCLAMYVHPHALTFSQTQHYIVHGQRCP